MSSNKSDGISAPPPLTRRGLLGRIGAGAGAVALGGGLGEMGQLLVPPAARSANDAR